MSMSRRRIFWLPRDPNVRFDLNFGLNEGATQRPLCARRRHATDGSTQSGIACEPRET
jgi:hypothetical protein